MERERVERKNKESLKAFAGGVGLRFERLKLHVVDFFSSLFCAIDQHDMPNCINGLLYDDKITG